MDLGLRGKVALVVGASEGMGLASARSLAREGAVVTIAGRTASRLAEAAASLAADGLDVGTVRGDADEAGGAAAIVGAVDDRHGRVDVLVNAVGGWEQEASILDFDARSWHHHLDTVVLSAHEACRAVVPGMVERGGGAIVNIVAQSSERHWPRIAAYSAMKAALAHLTKNLAREFGGRGVRVNGVRPGWILSESQRRRIDARNTAGASYDAVFAELLEEWPEVSWAGRFGAVEEVGDVVAFLASDRASYVNGALWPLDGGSPV